MTDTALTLRQLRYFQAVARHRHFGRAAEACAVSQPALSMQIQSLEALLGAPLLERRRDALALTETGRDVLARADAILRDITDLADAARHRGAVLTGRLALGAIPSIAPYLLPGALPLLQERHPALALELRETQTDRLLDALRDGALDVVLLALPVEDPALETMALFADPFMLATPLAEAESDQPATASALSRPDLLLLEEGHCLRDQALAVCGRMAPAARARFGASSLTTILQMVANGYGVTLLPALSIPAEILPGARIAVRRFAAPAPARQVGLAWRRSSPRKADFRALGTILIEAGAAVLGQPWPLGVN